MLPDFNTFINEFYESPMEKQILSNSRFIECVLKKAQAVYDDWEQIDGVDDNYGTGGICDDIAAGIAYCIELHLGMDSATMYNEYEYHTSAYAIDYNKRMVVKVDIPFRNYETGAGYTFTKIEGVKFTKDMILVEEQDFDDFEAMLEYQ